MFETIKKEWQAQVAAIFLLLYSLWWVYLQNNYEVSQHAVQVFAVSYTIMALWGGYWGLYVAEKWGLTKSVMGRAIVMFSLGLFAQSFGQIAYSYYVYALHIENPYPSIGDIGYFGSIPFYLYGVWLLGKASGVKIGFQSIVNKIIALIIPLIILSISYTLFLKEYEFDGTPIKIFLDFGYPLGQAVYVSLALLTYLLSRNVLGGVMKNKILFILFALVFQYICDFTFLYQTTNQTWQVGRINDYLYFVSYFVMTVAILQLHTAFNTLKE